MNKESILKKINYLIIVIDIILIIAIVVLATMIFISPTTEKIYENCIESVVELKASTDDVGDSYGTAVIIDESGKLITNAHFITYTKLGETMLFDNISIRYACEEDYRAVTVIKYDSEKDLAVLELVDVSNIQIVPLEFGNSADLKSGNIIYEDYEKNVIQCDIIITSGNSGGVLLNKKGNLIGITAFRTKDSQGNVVYGLAYSIPLNLVKDYINL